MEVLLMLAAILIVSMPFVGFILGILALRRVDHEKKEREALSAALTVIRRQLRKSQARIRDLEDRLRAPGVRGQEVQEPREVLLATEPPAVSAEEVPSPPEPVEPMVEPAPEIREGPTAEPEQEVLPEQEEPPLEVDLPVEQEPPEEPWQEPERPEAPEIPAAPPPVGATPGAGGWEKRMGILLPVWIGALALILSGAFLVKYSIDQGLLGPPARVTLATLLGIGLLVAGDRLWRRAPRTAQGSSAAGVAVLYGAFLAGTVLYGLIPTWIGFGLMLLVTLAAVVLSLRYGLIVAVLGLLGGFFTPYWIGPVGASPVRLFAYLLLLQAGVLLVAQRRRWTGLSALALVLGLGSVAHRTVGVRGMVDAPWMGMFLLLSTGIFLASAWRQKDRAPSVWIRLPGLEVSVGTLLGTLAMVGALLGLSALTARARFELREWAFLWLLAGASILLGRLDRAYRRLPWLSFLMMTGLQLGWLEAARPEERGALWLVAGATAGLFGLGGWLAHRRSAAPAWWATLSAAAGPVGFGLAWLADHSLGVSVSHWGPLSLAGAVAYLLPAVAAARRRGEGGEGALAAFCVAATVFVSLAVPLELRREWLSVAWAVEAAVLAWLLSRLRVRALGVLSALLGAGVAVRLLLNPLVLRYEFGALPVLNWLLYGYGIPAAAFAGAAYLFGRTRREEPRWSLVATGFAWGGAALLLALGTLQVRHGFHRFGLVTPRLGLVEIATYSHVWMGLGLALLAAYRYRRSPVLLQAGWVFFGIALSKILFLDLWLANPAWSHQSMGPWPVLNWLLYVYVPPILGLLATRHADAPVAPWARGCRLAAAGGIHLLLFALVTLQIRQFFHPDLLNQGSTMLHERTTYFVAWLLLAMGWVALWRRRSDVTALWAARGAYGLSLLTLLAMVVRNPLVWHQDVGGMPVANGLLYAYGLPLLLLLVVYRYPAGPDWERPQRQVAAWSGLVLGLTLLTLQVRQLFHPHFLDRASILELENYTYSAAWMLFALGLLAYGIARGGKAVRFASLAVIFLSVTKVFLWDLRRLTGLYRVGSFLALGISLMLISFLYQRFVFTERSQDGSS